MSIREHIRKLRGQGEPAHRAVVAAFGKHPGWDDHISDIGLNTDALSACKTWLYVEGIRSLLDQGTWDELSEEDRIDGYDHVFLQRVSEKSGKSRLGIGRGTNSGEGWLLGRMWSSTDGKGRTRYPMVVCVHVTGVELDWMFGEPLDALESLREKCCATKSAEDVRNAVKAEELHLQNALRHRASVGRNDAADENIYAALAEQPALGPDRQGFYRVMYQLDRDMSAYCPAGSRTSAGKSGSGSTAPAPRHMRVPSGEYGSSTPPTSVRGTNSRRHAAAALRQWMRLMEAELARSASVLLIAPLDGDDADGSSRQHAGWIDIIVGSPAAAQLKCLRCRPKHMPQVTDVPYQIESEFMQRIDGLVESPATPGAVTGDQRDASAHGSDAPPGNSSSAGRSQHLGRNPRLLGIGGAGAILLLIIVLMVMARDGDQIPHELRETYAAMHESWADDLFTAAASDAPVESAPAAHRVQLERFIDAHGGDPAIMSRIDRAQRKLGTAHARPALVRADTFATEQEIVEALAELRSLRDAFVELLKQPRTLARELDEARGWSVAADDIRKLTDEIERRFAERHRTRSQRGSINGSISEMLAALTDATETVHRIGDEWRELRAKQEKVRQWADEHDDDIVSRFSASVDHALAEAGVTTLPRIVEQWSGAAARVLHATDQWAGVDHAHLRESGAVYEDIDAATGDALAPERFIAWSDAVEDSEFALLPESDDPRLRRRDELRRWHEVLHENLTSYHRVCGDEAFADDHDTDAARQAGSRFDRAIDELEAMEWDRTRGQSRIISERLDEIGRMVAEQNQMLISAMNRCEGECEQRLATIAANGLPSVPKALQEQVDQLVMDAWSRIEAAVNEADSRCLALLEKAGNIVMFIERINRRVEAYQPPRFNPDTLPSGIGHAEVSEARQASQRDRIGGAVDTSRSINWSVGIDGAHPFWDDLEAGLADHARSLEQTSELLADFREIERQLKQAYGWADNGLEAHFAPWRDSATLAELARHVPEIAALEEAALLLWWIEEGDDGRSEGPFPALDATKLLTIASSETQLPAHRWAAWRRLDQHVDAKALLEWEQALDAPMRSMFESFDPPRADELREQFDSGRRDRWLRHAAAARDEQTLEAAFDAMDAFGVSPDELYGRLRLNMELRELREQALRLSQSRPGAQADTDRRRIEHLARAIEQRLDAIDDLPADGDERITALAAGLRAVIDFEADDDLKAGRGWNELALARAGWRPEASDDDAIVRFYPPDAWTAAHPELLAASQPLVFRRVHQDEHGAKYVAATAASVGLVIATVEQRGDWSNFRRHMDRYVHDADVGDPRRGPRVWDWRRTTGEPSGMVISSGWLRSERATCYPGNGVPGPPMPDHPMQYISAGGAAYVSLLLGCRLMTEAEWRAAFEMAGGRDAISDANLRGRRWLEYAEHAATVHNCDSPDRGAFVPRDRLRELGSDVAWEHRTAGGEPIVHDDGVLWFRPVRRFSGDAPFQEIIGNTWELIFDDADLWRELSPESLAEKLAAFTGQRDESGEPLLRVIGGSASSHHDLGVDQPLAVESAVLRAEDVWSVAFSDVGFRLAFSVAADEFGMDEGRQFRRMLSERMPQFAYVLAAEGEQ